MEDIERDVLSVLFQHFAGEHEENHENNYGVQTISEANFKLLPSRRQIMVAKHPNATVSHAIL